MIVLGSTSKMASTCLDQEFKGSVLQVLNGFNKVLMTKNIPNLSKNLTFTKLSFINRKFTSMEIRKKTLNESPFK